LTVVGHQLHLGGKTPALTADQRQRLGVHAQSGEIADAAGEKRDEIGDGDFGTGLVVGRLFVGDPRGLPDSRGVGRTVLGKAFGKQILGLAGLVLQQDSGIAVFEQNPGQVGRRQLGNRAADSGLAT
jgi:hypothetical protein